MNKQLFSNFYFFITVGTLVLSQAYSPNLHAGATINPGSTTTSGSSRSGNSSQLPAAGGSTGSEMTNPMTYTPKTSDSAAGLSKDASGKQDASKAINMATGTAMIGVGGYMIKSGLPMLDSPPTHGAGVGLIAMGSLMVIQGLGGLAQAAADGGASNGSGQSANDLGFGGPGGGTNGGIGKSLSGMTPTQQAAYDKATADLNKLGYTVDPKAMTITGPDGKTLGPSAASSAAGAAAAGLPSGSFEGASAKTGEILKAETDKALAGLKKGGIGDDSGGARMNIPVGGPDEGNMAAARIAAQNSANGNKFIRSPASVAGLSTNHNGGLIGVGNDDIFKMATRRYKVEDTQNKFLPGP